MIYHSKHSVLINMFKFLKWTNIFWDDGKNLFQIINPNTFKNILNHNNWYWSFQIRFNFFVSVFIRYCCLWLLALSYFACYLKKNRQSFKIIIFLNYLKEFTIIRVSASIICFSMKILNCIISISSSLLNSNNLARRLYFFYEQKDFRIYWIWLFSASNYSLILLTIIKCQIMSFYLYDYSKLFY